MGVKGYKDLIVWQKSVDLVCLVYKVTKTFPKEEIYGLASQIRRAAVSVPSNIAEGQARRSTAEFRYFLSIARGSLAEVETQLIIADRLHLISPEKKLQIFPLHEEISKMLSTLISKLATKHSPLTTKSC